MWFHLQQEPAETAEELMNGIKYVRPGNGFVPSLTMFKMVDVNGEEEHPLFTYLKQCCPPILDGFYAKHYLFYDPLRNTDLRWNFEKFLITRTGKPYKRYHSAIAPALIEEDIRFLLRETL